ncbi:MULTISPECIES: hypothetical protein [Flavobacterium]|uniref:hypothetical protein n=1 Tax=Flavobacterium TaxID=237 RepID=UPI001183FB2C|nr:MULTISPECIES: hypothetical protein [Flavobacterium]MCR4030431.1 hypothetical protein [Flavobacterium panacis]
MELIEITEPTILIRINKTYSPTMSKQSLYDYSRGRWKLKIDRAKKAKIALSIFDGIVVEVFEIKSWHNAGKTESSRKPNDRPDLNSTKSLVGRIEFQGEIAAESIRKKYLNKSVKQYFKKGNMNPVKYVNV